MRRCTLPSGKEAADILISAVLLAVYYVSAVFLAEMISYKSTVLSLLFILCTAGMYGLALISGSNGAALCKWLLSLPLGILCFEFFWRTNFAVRALNLAFPGYGKQSAGGAFAGFLGLLLLTVLCMAGALAAVCIPPEQKPRLLRIRRVICPVCGAALVLTVLLLERQLPPYSTVLAQM